MNRIISAIALIILVTVAGCMSGNEDFMSGNTAAPKFTVTPSDGATGVRLDAGITLSFDQPVDRLITEQGTHLFSQKDMMDSTCPMSAMMEVGMMDSAMMDSVGMRHLIERHSTAVHFEWNSAGTLCSMRPDSMMLTDMQYMIHMDQEMMQMMESRIGEMGMMSGHGTGSMGQNMMIHFKTMTVSNGGHDDHH